MQILSGVSPSFTTTNTNTLVSGSILNASAALSVSFTIRNTGDSHTLSYEVIGGNVPDLSDGVVVQNSANVTHGNVGSYATQVAPYAYYGIKVVSTANNSHTTGSIFGRAKG